MISVENAIEKIHDGCVRLPSIMISTVNALGMTVAEDVFSEITFPPFDQSAMDGYGVNINDSETDYQLIGEIKAGDNANEIEVETGQAVRIFTGAMVPESVNAVVKQEDVEKHDGFVRINRSIRLHENIRPAGEQIKKGEIVLKKGTLINAGTVGFLSMLGIPEVRVIQKPRIAIVTTGNELVQPGEQITPGKIYNSNANMLLAALHSYGFEAESISVKDDYELTKQGISRAIIDNDLVLITGGISVGDYDYVGSVLKELNVSEEFYKVRQKPGKPLYFGTREEKVIFGLPGNPASVLTCFYVYVLEALSKMTGRGSSFTMRKKASLSGIYNKTPVMTHFLKGFEKNGKVEILTAQSSAMLSDFVKANCFLVMEEGRENWRENDMVDILDFTNSFS